MSDRARGLDTDFQSFTGTPRAIRDYEALLTLSYLAQIRDGFAVLPTFQYVMHPGGGADNPTDPAGGQPLRDAAVFGLRTLVKF